MKKVIGILIFIQLLLFFVLHSPHQKDLVLVTCDVGQGDAHIILYHDVQILVDAGEKKDVLACLGKYMPQTDHHIEIAIMTHPEFDHAGGFNAVLERYEIGMIFANRVDNSTDSFRLLKNKVGDLSIPVIQPKDHDELKIDDLVIHFTHPSTDLVGTRGKILLGEETPALNLNDYSLTFRLSQGGVTALYTGDISPEQISNMLARGRIGHVNLLKIPHHGSKNGVTNQLLADTTPDISVISVGKKNKFGHPDQEVLNLLSEYKTQVYRTDLQGDVAFKNENGKLVFQP